MFAEARNAATHDPCQHVWGQQKRYLQYRGCVNETPSCVSKLLPQGDALSVVALLAVHSMPTLDIS